MGEASTQQPSVCPSQVKHLDISKHWNDTHWGAPMFSLVVFMAWWGLGFGWPSPFDRVWTAPTGLYLSGEFGASWGWGKAGFMWAERTGETPLTFATWASGTVPFWVAPKHKHKCFTKCITGKQLWTQHCLNLNFRTVNHWQADTHLVGLLWTEPLLLSVLSHEGLKHLSSALEWDHTPETKHTISPLVRN